MHLHRIQFIGKDRKYHITSNGVAVSDTLKKNYKRLYVNEEDSNILALLEKDRDYLRWYLVHLMYRELKSYEHSDSSPTSELILWYVTDIPEDISIQGHIIYIDIREQSVKIKFNTIIMPNWDIQINHDEFENIRVLTELDDSLAYQLCIDTAKKYQPNIEELLNA